MADVVGPELLDQVLAEFYRDHMNGAARMQDMLDLLEERADPDDRVAIDTLVADWLLRLECPADYARRCGVHQGPTGD